MSRIIRSKSFYRTFFILTISIALQNLLTYSVNLADNMMIGRYSQDAMSAISLCNQLQFSLQMLVIGVSEGVLLLGAQYWGKKETQPIRHIIGVGLRFGLGLASVLFLVTLFFPSQMLGLLTGLAIYQSRYFVLSFYPTLDAQASQTALQFIAVMAITSIGTCYQMATDTGIIRAGGSPSFSMKNNFVFIWCIALPMAYLSAYVWALPSIVVFFWLKSDQLLKCPVIFLYANSYKWMKNVTRETTPQ